MREKKKARRNEWLGGRRAKENAEREKEDNEKKREKEIAKTYH